jgi:hypothetical protein
VEGGKLTGGLIGPITDSAVKAAVLREEAWRLGEGALSLATGDGANDIPMIEAGDLRLCLPRQAQGARGGQRPGRSGDLTAVLTLLGIPARMARRLIGREPATRKKGFVYERESAINTNVSKPWHLAGLNRFQDSPGMTVSRPITPACLPPMARCCVTPTGPNRAIARCARCAISRS